MRIDRISGMAVSWFIPGFCKISCWSTFYYMCFVFFALLVFVSVSFVPNVKGFSGLSFLDCHFGFR